MAQEHIDLQRKLKALGYNPGAIDGDLGPKSLRAIALFRSDFNIAEGESAVLTGLADAAAGRLGMSPLARITPDRLRELAPNANVAVLAPILDRECSTHRILTPRRVRQFLAQLVHESGGLTKFEENLRYRDPARLDEIFSAVRGIADARALIAKGPQAIANRVYANRGGNGNEASGDGWRYRGMGPIQITGKDNCRAASAWTGVDLVRNPELLLTPAIGIRAACGFWVANKINEMVDEDANEGAIGNITQHLRLNEEDDVRQATRAVNGPASEGLAERRLVLERAGQIWRRP
jgi:putative chitinase